MLTYSSLAYSSFKLRSFFPSTIVLGSLEFSFLSLDIVDRGIFFSSSSISSYLASSILRASFYSRSSSLF